MLKLMYLPLRARGEALRMLLRHADIPFVDHIVPFSEWPALKPNVPNNQLPQLQLGSSGRLLPQSKDIALHIASLAGPPLLPSDAATAEDALDCWQILHSTSVPHLAVGSDPWGEKVPWDARLGAVNPLLNFLPADVALPIIPSYLAGARGWLHNVVELRLSTTPGPFMGGKAPHHGDFATFHVVDNICTLDGGQLLASASPRAQQWHGAMHDLPAVASYLRQRPQAGSGEVGKPGSLIFEHARPADIVARALELGSAG
jgi:glutathione S-transferase